MAAEAVSERAHNDRTTARTIVDTLERVAGTITVATNGDPDVPTRGSFDLLPEGIRDSLAREDRVVHGVEVFGDTALRQTTVLGVEDTHAIASIVSAGDGEYRNGSELDKQLLAAGREYLDAGALERSADRDETGSCDRRDRRSTEFPTAQLHCTSSDSRHSDRDQSRVSNRVR